MVDQILNNLQWLGHSSFLITAQGKNIYIDPYKIPDDLPQADIILITHEHYDHCSPEDVAKIQGAKTVIVTEVDSAGKLEGTVKNIAVGQSIEVKGIDVEAVAAYNINKKFHPKTNGWLGFLITVDGVTLYHAGDTDYIPEMQAITADIALLPVSGTYVMTAAEAVQAALLITPTVVVPMHFGSLVGTVDDADEFSKALQGKVRVKVLGEK